ncbi:MAG: hypothetical protein JO172_01890, partial [Hyphomicrobiales bacterium]|nr:hypothetical protein [Hyphomicrobiales bacterium]
PNFFYRALHNDAWFHGRYEEALDYAQKAFVEQSWLDQENIAYTLSSLGRIDEAKAHIATLLKLKPGLTIRQIMAYQTMWCIEPAYREKQANALRQAGLPE